jgi:hypothetical protein
MPGSSSTPSTSTRPLGAGVSAAGFRIIGTRERIGQHHGRWRDVLFIERRSPAI